jgi:hypothetical protein
MPKKSIITKVLLIAAAFIYLTGCTDLFTNPSNSVSSISSKLKITVFSPKSNDTIVYKNTTTITYTITKDSGINYVELYLNNVFFSHNAVNSDGTQPTITFTLDTSYIGKRISYYLIYYDNDSYSTRSDTMSNILVADVSKIPYVPYNLTFTMISSSELNLSWSDSTTLTSPGYEVWRQRGFYGQFTRYLIANPNSYNVNDPDADDTTVYYYKIRGLNAYGTSAFSAVINTYGAGAARSIPPPLNLVATSSAATVVKLTWTDDVGVENYYKIERRYSWTTYVDVGFASKGATQYVDSASGLTGSATYIYRVKAIAGNDSSWSNEATVTTPWQ